MTLMINLKKTACIVIIAILLMICLAPMSLAQTESGNKKGQTVVGNGEPIEAPIDVESAEKRLESMTKVTENSKYEFYFDFVHLNSAVKTKATGQIILSNPYNLSGVKSSQDIKDGFYAQLELTYFNKTFDSYKLSSWKDAVSKGQYEASETENGVEVLMTLGEATGNLLLPRSMPAESYKKIHDAIPEKDQKKFSRVYKIYGEEHAVNAKELEEWRKNYPIISEMDIYVLRQASTREMKDLSRLVSATGYTFEDMDADHALTKYEGEDLSLASFDVTMEYTLTEDGLVVNVPAEKIMFDDEAFYLSEITPLPFMGSGFSGEEDSYIFYPDGSGTLIKYTNESSRSTNQIAMKFYGTDYSDIETAIYEPRETALRLPVFGNKNDGSSFIATVESGAAVGKLTAQVGNEANPINTVFTTFTYNNRLQYVFEEINFDQNVTLFANKKNITDYKICYIPVDTESGYVGMAESYREFLLKNGQLSEKDSTEEYPLYVELLGGIETQEEVFGFPVDKMTPFNTFEDTENIMNTLKEKSINNAVLKYLGWNDGGLENKAITKVKPLNALGGKKGMKDVISSAKDNGMKLYFSADFTSIRQDSMFDDFSPQKDSPRNLIKNVVGYSNLNAATNKYDRYSFSYLVSPSRFQSYTNKFISKFKSYNSDLIAFDNAGRFLYSDLRKKNPVSASESLNYVTAALGSISDEYSMQFDAGNAYVLKYASNLTDIATSSNNYLLQDENVPFYQMVVGGKISYAAPTLSTAGEPEIELLKNIETGSAISYTVASQNHQKLKYTMFAVNYSASFQNQLDEIISFYNTASDAIGNQAGNRIVNHEILESGVRRTSFSSGNKVTVNYNSYDVEIDGTVVKAKSFIKK